GADGARDLPRAVEVWVAAVVVGPRIHPNIEHARDVRVRLANRRAWSQTGYAVIAEAGQDLTPRIERQRDKQVEILVLDLKTLRHHAHDLPSLRIDLDVLSDHRRFAAKTLLPIVVAQLRDLPA